MHNPDPIECLMKAIQTVWTGTLEISSESKVVGHIVFNAGRIAWATCKGLADSLGVFLWRLGRISHEDLQKVERKFRQQKGKKKLGTLLEEEGLMNRTVLRRCLMLHTRSAIAKIFSQENIRAKMIEHAPSIDEQIIFGPEEVLPSDLSTLMVEHYLTPINTWIKTWYTRNRENEILAELMDLPGYLASAVISDDGGVIAGHIDHESVDLVALSVFLAAMVEASNRAIHSTCLNTANFIELECEGGWLTCRWINTSYQHLVFVLIDKQGNPSLTRYQLRQSAHQIEDWLQGSFQSETTQERIKEESTVEQTPKDHFPDSGDLNSPENVDPHQHQEDILSAAPKLSNIRPIPDLFAAVSEKTPLTKPSMSKTGEELLSAIRRSHPTKDDS